MLAPVGLEYEDDDDDVADGGKEENIGVNGDVNEEGDGDTPRPKVARRPMSAHLVLMDHFVPRAGFGAVIMSLTLFSTLFSGYSVVGIPDDTFVAGFYGMRWLASTLPGITAMLLSVPSVRALVALSRFVGCVGLCAPDHIV